MIGPWDVIVLVYVLGVAYQAPRVLKRWALITSCEPIQLCDACRDERRQVMHDADQWEVLGVFGSALMVMLEAAAWYLKPLVPASRKALGKELLPRCSKGTCLAHTGKAAA
ncbi:hypothetical protein [Nonomuraea cavernae]|uniref:Uncharacterized protein n=1 Tax=Nonomuraea cavernae TaxID=2045107 RepID=A0A917YQ06_9ACTN|nr:hypothetical protein [Nonomuraea cavernae]MCA2184698.1 hypothetical protein [Nonomuraea cavernae]GGO63029.1 hypothetical protein GCM10012289_08990 [Nonomuraea cavernae]